MKTTTLAFIVLAWVGSVSAWYTSQQEGSRAIQIIQKAGAANRSATVGSTCALVIVDENENFNCTDRAIRTCKDGPCAYSGWDNGTEPLHTLCNGFEGDDDYTLYTAEAQTCDVGLSPHSYLLPPSLNVHDRNQCQQVCCSSFLSRSSFVTHRAHAHRAANVTPIMQGVIVSANNHDDMPRIIRYSIGSAFSLVILGLQISWCIRARRRKRQAAAAAAAAHPKYEIVSVV